VCSGDLELKKKKKRKKTVGFRLTRSVLALCAVCACCAVFLLVLKNTYKKDKKKKKKLQTPQKHLKIGRGGAITGNIVQHIAQLRGCLQKILLCNKASK